MGHTDQQDGGAVKMISCDCDFYEEPGPGQWYYTGNLLLTFEPLKSTKQKRCCSCDKLISIGDICLVFIRHRYPHTEIEARITGTDWGLNEEPPIKIANQYHCEICGEIYLNLSNLGYCIFPAENMGAVLKEYHELSNFKGAK